MAWPGCSAYGGPWTRPFAGRPRRRLAVRMDLGELPHALVPGRVPEPVPEEIAAAEHHLDAGVEEAREEPVLEALVEVAHAPQLIGRPRAPDTGLVGAQALLREVAGEQAIEHRLRRQHAGLDGEVDSLEPRPIQEAARVTAEEEPFGRELRHRPPAALGDGLGSIGDRLAALEQRPDQRVSLEALEIEVGIGGRVAVVEAGHEAHRPVTVIDPVDEAAAERLVR